MALRLAGLVINTVIGSVRQEGHVIGDRGSSIAEFYAMHYVRKELVRVLTAAPNKQMLFSSHTLKHFRGSNENWIHYVFHVSSDWIHAAASDRIVMIVWKIVVGTKLIAGPGAEYNWRCLASIFPNRLKYKCLRYRRLGFNVRSLESA